MIERIQEEIIRYFKERHGEHVRLDTPLVEEQVVDSMGVMDLVRFIQERFEVELDMEDLTVDHFESVRSISELVVSKRDGTWA